MSSELCGDIEVIVPGVPVIDIADPTPEIDIVPVAGPQGVPGGTGAMAFTKTVFIPATLVQIQHGLTFPPAGITCIESDGTQVEYAAVTHPQPGITEVTFGVAFTGDIYLS